MVRKTNPSLSGTNQINANTHQRRIFVILLAILSFFAVMQARCALVAGWDMTGPGDTATLAATSFAANLDGSSLITRGSSAPASVGMNSFRTQGFQNDGISTANQDFFQMTLSAASGFTLSLTTIDAGFKGTGSFRASPGVLAQFAYSLDGTTFNLIGSAFSLTTDSAMQTIDLSGIAALQNVPDSSTVTIRYYASGQTATGGWGFYSSASGVNGLAFGGTLTAVPEPSTVVAGALLLLPLGVGSVWFLRNRKRA